VAQLPYAGKPVECITRTGAGALNVDGGRIGTRSENESGWSKSGSKPSENRAMSGANYARPPKDETGVGRWPANLLLLDEGAAMRLDSQSGVRSGGHWSYKQAKDGGLYKHGLKDMEDAGSEQSDTGASKFFYQVQTQLNEADPIRYCAKASRSQRNAGLEDSFFLKSDTPKEVIAEIERHLLSD